MNCSNCNQPFDAHTVIVGTTDRQCADGGSFDVVFHINPEVLEFVKENADKHPDELAQMWIDKIIARDRATHQK